MKYIIALVVYSATLSWAAQNVPVLAAVLVVIALVYAFNEI